MKILFSLISAAAIVFNLILFSAGGNLPQKNTGFRNSILIRPGNVLDATVIWADSAVEAAVLFRDKTGEAPVRVIPGLIGEEDGPFLVPQKNLFFGIDPLYLCFFLWLVLIRPLTDRFFPSTWLVLLDPALLRERILPGAWILLPAFLLHYIRLGITIRITAKDPVYGNRIYVPFLSQVLTAVLIGITLTFIPIENHTAKEIISQAGILSALVLTAAPFVLAIKKRKPGLKKMRERRYILAALSLLSIPALLAAADISRTLFMWVIGKSSFFFAGQLSADRLVSLLVVVLVYGPMLYGVCVLSFKAVGKSLSPIPGKIRLSRLSPPFRFLLGYFLYLGELIVSYFLSGFTIP